MKKAIGIFIVLFTLASLPSVNANESAPAIAIIDTGVDTSQVKVLHEVCIMEELRCPNNKSYMEGTGAAYRAAINGFEHGTQMVKAAQSVNPNINIVFIRIYPADRYNKMIVRNAANANSTVRQALEWVAKNKTRFNIVAVSTSLGESRFLSGSSYCPVNTGLRSIIVTLQNMGVGSLFAAGNRYDYSRVDYPACISEAIAVSAVGVRGNVERYSNRAIQTDFFALGTINGSVGTSPATAALAAYWAKNYKGNYADTYNYLKSIGKPAALEQFSTNLFVDVLG